MVAYNFRRFLVPPIIAGTKIHTIREGRKNPPPSRKHVGGHALPGDEVQLYTGMRQPGCQLIGRAVCKRTIRITVEVIHSWVDLYETPGKKPRRLNCWDGSHIELDPFALADGFKDWSDFWIYWNKQIARNERTDLQLLDGWLIEWGALTEVHDVRL